MAVGRQEAGDWTVAVPELELMIWLVVPGRLSPAERWSVAVDEGLVGVSASWRLCLGDCFERDIETWSGFDEYLLPKKKYYFFYGRQNALVIVVAAAALVVAVRQIGMVSVLRLLLGRK